MPSFERSRACLRVMGDSLVPEEISLLLGSEATQGQRQGEEIIGASSGRVRTARIGMWRLIAEPRVPEDLGGQIEELLGRLTNDLAAWAAIRKTCRIDLFCGLFMGSGNAGILLLPRHLLLLGERGIELDLDIYDSSN